MTENRQAGVLLVGLAGMTATTAVAAALSLDRADLRLGSLISGGTDGPSTLPDVASLVFGGWDFVDIDLLAAVKGHNIFPGSLASFALERIEPMPAVIGVTDVLEAEASMHRHGASSLADMIDAVADDIRGFRKLHSVEDVVLIYLGSPAAWSRVEDPFAFNYASSQLAYALGAAATGTAFVDFTPNLTLEHPRVVAALERSGVPYAGRDGSTGQTFLKAVLYEVLQERGLVVDGWYSTNLIGNNDGLVLARNEHSDIKLADKAGPLKHADSVAHTVRIEYFPPAGDNKEAWDAVYFHGLAGLPMSMRINWQGRDSLLAAPLVIDLARLMIHAVREGASGYQAQLAVFFKRPFEDPIPPFSDALARLRSTYPWTARK